MINKLSTITAPATVEPLRLTDSTKPAESFQSLLQGAMKRVESSSANASEAVEKFLSGDGGELHSTVLATQRASLEFDMFLQVRNKVVQAYQEIMRAQL